MKILRLTNSSDVHPGVPPEERSPAIVERIVSAAIGEPVETVIKGLWPTPGFPAVLERSVKEFEPDVVFIRLSSYWVAYESVPLRIRRRLPRRVGEPVANAGVRLGDRPWLIDHRAYKLARTAVVRTVGGDTFFTPGEVGETFDAMFKRIHADESLVTVVRGTNLLLNSAGTKSGLERAKRRVTALNQEVEAACKRNRVQFFAEPPATGLSRNRLRDDLHDSSDAHRRLGEDDAAAILQVLRGGG